MTFDVRLPDGRIVPELAVLLRGARELDRLESEGMTVDRARANTWTLGKAAIVADPPPDLTDQQRLLLTKIEQRNAVELARLNGTAWYCSCAACSRPAPDGAYMAPEIEGTDESGGVDHGQVGELVRAQQGKRRARRSRNRVRSVSYVQAEEDDGYEPF